MESRSTEPPPLAQLRRLIDREAAHPEFDAEAVRTQFGLSRTALYRMFTPLGGVAAVIRQRRAALAVQQLTQPGASRLTLAAVAQASGFSTERSLRNALREHYGMSPRAILRNGIERAALEELRAEEIGRLFDEL